eukprot:Filipodium_phascolosomae@DN814_c0_g1_i1.p3
MYVCGEATEVSQTAERSSAFVNIYGPFKRPEKCVSDILLSSENDGKVAINNDKDGSLSCWCFQDRSSSTGKLIAALKEDATLGPLDKLTKRADKRPRLK